MFARIVVCLLLTATAAWADEPKPVAVPYKLTTTQHVLVRLKLNGKGPFHFILDTGAPAMFVTTKVAEKAGVTPNSRGWGKFDRVEVEGGVVFEQADGRVEDIFQLQGMNGMGLAGVELHGVVGYNLLARYRIEFDFTRDTLAWTRLDFEPPAISRMGGKGSGGLDALGGIVKVMGALLGLKPNFAVMPRGFLGAELADDASTVIVKRLLPEGPAARAGLRVGDRIGAIDGEAVKSSDDAAKRLGKYGAGVKLKVAVDRAGTAHELSIELGKGL